MTTLAPKTSTNQLTMRPAAEERTKAMLGDDRRTPPPTPRVADERTAKPPHHAARVAQPQRTTGSFTSMQALQQCPSRRAPKLVASGTLIRAPAARPSPTLAPRAAQPTDETAACPYWSGRLIGPDLLGGPNKGQPPTHGCPTHSSDADTHRDATDDRDQPGTAAARTPTWLPSAAAAFSSRKVAVR